ncbi:hypothetical protein Tco_0974884 [Tanacetum coccineum]|uniref:Uncharacterized protein n=1 Tax=Tanacetum coccineum TaxID=301880 RepID=A0ABQ5ECZ8_9ASTR
MLIKSSQLDGTYLRKDFQAYTGMKPQDFKERILKDFDFIQKYMIESILNDKAIKQRMNAQRLQKQGEVDMDNALDASPVLTESSGIDFGKKNDCSKTGNDQISENQSSTSRNKSSRSRNECNEKSTSGDDTDIRPSYDTEPMDEVDNNTTPDSSDMCNNEFKDDQNDDHEDERVVLANLIANLKLDIDENKKIQKQLRNANTTLTHELKEWKSTLEETNTTLGESKRTRDRYLGALHDKEVELAKYKNYHDRTIENDTLERKLKETLGLLAQKEHDIKEALKIKAYEIFVVKEKNDELVKQSLLTNSRYEGLVKEKNKIPYDKDDLANIFFPDREETLTLEQESRSKLHKDIVKPYDYSKQNSLYENFKPPSREYLDQLAHANEVRKKMWRKSFVKYKPHIVKNIDAHTELQCLYLYKIKECECLTEKLSKQTENVGKQEYNELLKSFSKLEQHSISLELVLQQCQEQIKIDTVCIEKASNVFLKERDQYFKIQDLKAQLQDKNITISELKKLTEKMKDKSVDTNFEKQSILGKPPLQPIKNQPVVRQLTAYKSERSQVAKHRSASQVDVSNNLKKPITPHSWPQVRKLSFAKPYDVNAPGSSRNRPKHVSFQSQRESVGSNDMVHNYYLQEAKKYA